MATTLYINDRLAAGLKEAYEKVRERKGVRFNRWSAMAQGWLIERVEQELSTTKGAA